jgi:GH25 family lysozyme M1 (1,4-beta-N-acetylmuramidase)
LTGPPAPGWMNGYAKGLDVTTQFRDAQNPLFNWDAVVAAEQFKVPGGRVTNDHISFIVIKATLGSGPDAVAKNFKENWAKLGSLGRKVIRGAYHFLRFGPDANPVAQAEEYLKAVGPFYAILPPVLDVEDMSPPVLDFLGIKKDVGVVNKAKFEKNVAKCVDDIRTWVKTVKAATHRDPIIYTFRSYWKDLIGNPTEFKDLPLWIANYTMPAEGPAKLKFDFGGWKTWAYWQFAGFPQSRTQFVPGIGAAVDLNLFNGTAVELQAKVYENMYTPALPVGNF